MNRLLCTDWLKMQEVRNCRTRSILKILTGSQPQQRFKPSDYCINCRVSVEFKTVFSNILVILKYIAHYNSVFYNCINTTSTKYGLPDTKHFENLVRHSEKGIDSEIYENILRNRSVLLVGICVTFPCFQTLRPRKRGFLPETDFLFHMDWYHFDGPSFSESKEPRFWLLEIEADAVLHIHLFQKMLSGERPMSIVERRWHDWKKCGYWILIGNNLPWCRLQKVTTFDGESYSLSIFFSIQWQRLNLSRLLWKDSWTLYFQISGERWC